MNRTVVHRGRVRIQPEFPVDNTLENLRHVVFVQKWKPNQQIVTQHARGDEGPPAAGYSHLGKQSDVDHRLEWMGRIFAVIPSASAPRLGLEGILNFINKLLNSAEIPNLFAPDEKSNVQEMVRKR